MQFPTLPSGSLPDSSKYVVTMIDNTLYQQMEGGYTTSRARTTRPMRRKFWVAYTFLEDADQVVIENFYDACKGGAIVFQWTSPHDNLSYNVRFKGDLAMTYVGKGGVHHWDCSFELEQA